MDSKKPIVILEDDVEEHELFSAAFQNLEVLNPLKFFTDGEVFLEYLLQTIEKPLIIISAVNLHKMDGLEVRRQIQQTDFLRRKGIPFVFFTVKDDNIIVNQAYDLTVQGYFIKGSTMKELQSELKLIIDYWTKCLHPNI